VVGLTGEKIAGIMPLNYGKPCAASANATLPTGQEVTYFGSDDGYVYQDNVGTSFDGAADRGVAAPGLQQPEARRACASSTGARSSRSTARATRR
jgi:hypothetical protein